MAMYSEKLPATGGSLSARHILLIHGWGHSSAIWRSFLPYLRKQCNLTLLDLPGFGKSPGPFPASVDTLLDTLAEHCPDGTVVIGFSLGGMLAVQLAARYPDKVSAVITLASNWRFVADEAWPQGMAGESFDAFYRTVAARPAAGLKRFNALQVRGDVNEKQLLRSLRTEEPLPIDSDLSQSLQVLAQLDNRSLCARLSQPSLHLLADSDALVPATAAQAMMAAGANVKVITESAHPLFLSQPERCAEEIQAFMLDAGLVDDVPSRRLLDKRSVARSFSRAAASYDSVAELQRDVAGTLLAELPRLPAWTTVADVGCGTGFCLPVLRSQYPECALLGIDIADGMLSYAAQRHGSLAVQWLCADAENLPLADASIDLMVSSLAMQWCEDTQALLSEVYRTLRRGGQFHFSTLGPQTLFELRNAWQSADGYVHVNQFCDRDMLAKAVRLAGFAGMSLREQSVVLRYPSVKDSTLALKHLGASNSNYGRAQGLTGRQRLVAFKHAYEAQRDSDGLLPASYQVWYGCLQKPE